MMIRSTYPGPSVPALGRRASQAGSRSRSSVASAGDLGRAVSLLPGRLWLLPNQALCPRDTSEATFIHVEASLHYEPFFLDYGPYNLGMLKRFVDLVDDAVRGEQRVYVCCGPDAKRRANAACLCASYLVLRHSVPPQQAVDAVSSLHTAPFHDASTGVDCFHLTYRDVVHGLARAVSLGWFDVSSFSAAEYEHYEQIEHGDYNWIIPGKILAFSGPSGPHTRFTPEMYVNLFRKIGVNCVVRLNERRYNRSVFVQSDLRHFDLVFPDGMNPPEQILRKFLSIAEDPELVIGIHCKAGLGRTGTLIGSYLVKHFQFSAAEAIGWLRLCRPGSVIGPQQHFLQDIQPLLRKSGLEHPVGTSRGVREGAAAAATLYPRRADTSVQQRAAVTPYVRQSAPPAQVPPASAPPGKGGLGGLDAAATSQATDGPSAKSGARPARPGLAARLHTATADAVRCGAPGFRAGVSAASERSRSPIRGSPVVGLRGGAAMRNSSPVGSRMLG